MSQSTGPLRVADLLVDLERRSIRRGAEALELTDRSFRLFEALLRHAPDEVTKDQLIAEVWNDAVVSDETLAQRVRLLRQSLGDDSQNPRYIAAVRGRGYRLKANVSDAAEDANRWRRGWRVALIALPVLLGILLTWQLTRDVHNTAEQPDALAVLPFKDMSANQEHQFFADGMHEELLSRLAMIDGLSVTSRTSVERYRETSESLPAIAAQLGADAVVEGSVRIDGDKLRVTVQLIDAASDEHQWAANFDRQLSVQDIFELQSEVAVTIAEQLRLEYSDSTNRSIPLPTDSIEAYNLYLLGRFHVFKQTPADLERAVGYLTKAIEIDAEFAEAYASLGWAYSFLGTGYGAQAPAEMYPQAREAALRALALDGDLPDARTLYADILTWYDWDFVAAEREYQKTVELDPLNILGYALYLSTQERHDEAIALIERRIEAHPNDPYVWVNAGWRYLNAGLTEKAIDAARRAAEHADSTPIIGWSLLADGDTASAVALFESAVQQEGPTIRNVTNLAVAYFRDDRRADGQRWLRELRGANIGNAASPGSLAAVYFAAGDADRGFELLEEAYANRSREMIFLRVSETLRGYRDDPRFADLVARVGL